MHVVGLRGRILKNTKRDILLYEEKLSDNNVVLNQVLRLIKDTKNLDVLSPIIYLLWQELTMLGFQNKRPQLFFLRVYKDCFLL